MASRTPRPDTFVPIHAHSIDDLPIGTGINQIPLAQDIPGLVPPGGGFWTEVGTTVQLLHPLYQVGIGSAPGAGIKLDVDATGGFMGGRYLLATATTRWVWLGRIGPYGREEVWFTGANSVLRLGACSSDGDAFDQPSEGIVMYNPGTNKLARIKPDRFGLTRCTDSAVYYWRVDDAKFVYGSDPTPVLPGPIYVYPVGPMFYMNRSTGFMGIGNSLASDANGYPIPAGPELLRVQGDVRVDRALRLAPSPTPVVGAEGALFVSDGSDPLALPAGSLYYKPPGVAAPVFIA